MNGDGVPLPVIVVPYDPPKQKRLGRLVHQFKHDIWPQPCSTSSYEETLLKQGDAPCRRTYRRPPPCRSKPRRQPAEHHPECLQTLCLSSLYLECTNLRVGPLNTPKELLSRKPRGCPLSRARSTSFPRSFRRHYVRLYSIIHLRLDTTSTRRRLVSVTTPY